MRTCFDREHLSGTLAGAERDPVTPAECVTSVSIGSAFSVCRKQTFGSATRRKLVTHSAEGVAARSDLADSSLTEISKKKNISVFQRS